MSLMGTRLQACGRAVAAAEAGESYGYRRWKEARRAWVSNPRRRRRGGRSPSDGLRRLPRGGGKADGVTMGLDIHLGR